MENVVKEISRGVYGMAIWSEEMNTYLNCYLIKNQGGHTLIDTAAQHPEELTGMLRTIGVEPADIRTVILTHGHKDHTGNIGLFGKADKYIHGSDLELATRGKDKGMFKVLSGCCGEAADLEWMLTGGHTTGSISLYHNPSKTLIIGDIICFFGVPLPPDGLLSEARELRELWYELVSFGGLSESLKAQNIEMEAYKDSIKKLAAQDADYLCTGHGVVLKQDIQKFLNSILEAIR